MQRFVDAYTAREKYKDELIRIGATSVHVGLRKQPLHGKTESYRIFILIHVPDQNHKNAIEKFLATLKHPGRLDRFQTEVIITKKTRRTCPNIRLK